MAVLKKIKRQEVPFILDGKTIFKCVTKNTTCSDVINKLPDLQTPLAVFESVDGIEKELKGKTKLLKVWRAKGATRKVAFIIKRSQILTNVKKSIKKLSPDTTNCTFSSVKSASGKELSKDTLKQVSDLAFYVRYQKTKLQALNKNCDDNAGTSERNRLMKRMTSDVSVSSMDAFLAKADLNEMAKFLTFCGEVATEKLCNGKQRKQSTRTSEETLSCHRQQMTRHTNSRSKFNETVTRKSLKSTKLGLKHKFVKEKTVERTTSTGTISSTDTGYQSVDSDYERFSKISATSVGKPKCISQISKRIAEGPRHSTPVSAPRTQKRKVGDIDATFNIDATLSSDNLKYMNEIQGKSIILQKFITEQTGAVSAELPGNDEFESLNVKRRRIGHSMPTVTSQTDVCRFLWDTNCDSDSECESDISEPCETLYLGFNAGNIDCNDTIKSQSRTLRRKSAISNLNRLSLVSWDTNANTMKESETRTLRRESAISNLNQFSLLSRDIGVDTLDDSNGFDYSFDCSFPRMDETKSEDFSMDFSYDYDESDSENESVCNEDDCIDSFMKTRSFIDVSGDITTCEVNGDTERWSS